MIEDLSIKFKPTFSNILLEKRYRLSLEKLNWKVASLLFILVIMFSFPLSFGVDEEFLPFGEVNIRLYVVALDEVGGYSVDIITTMVEGVFATSKVNSTLERVNIPTPHWPWSYGEVKINTNAIVIRDWDTYREVVESSSNAIIVNAHGEVVPVPAGYTKEAWADKIADAMANRNATWVHTAGYPFYYYHHQESGWGEWREQGFQRLMSHIDKGNVTCHPPHGLYEGKLISITTDAQDRLLFNWMFEKAFFVSPGKPLYGPDWNNSIILAIWGVEYDYMPGAVIEFGNRTHNFGFYVHIGTNQTYDSLQLPTDKDFWRGYMGAAAAIWANAWRFAAEDTISKAEAAITKAEIEGRTKGLDEAKRLLQRAIKCFETRQTEEFEVIIAFSGWANAILRAIEARDAAENATEPSFMETHAPLIAILGVSAGATPIILALRWRRNAKKKEDEAK